MRKGQGEGLRQRAAAGNGSEGQRRRRSSGGDGGEEEVAKGIAAAAAVRRAYKDVHPALLDIDPATRWFYNPRTMTVLMISLAIIAYKAGVFFPTDDGAKGVDYGTVVAGAGRVQGISEAGAVTVAPRSAFNANQGVWAAVIMFLMYSATHGPRTSMVRPHPVVWRLVHGLAVLYALFLVYLLFQDIDDARAFMRHLHPNLGTEVSYRSYAADCQLFVRPRRTALNNTDCSSLDRDAAAACAAAQQGATGDQGGWQFNWRAIKSTLVDEFVLAHLIGWWGKACVFRNWSVLWMMSVGFELIELTFRHMLPNFNECWWDSWILDVLGCNLLGIWLGMLTVRWAECRYKQYNWEGISQLKGFKAKAKRSLAQLGPYTWDSYNWFAFSSPTRFLQTLGIVYFTVAMELNAFFLKFALWVPPSYLLNTYRLLFWWAIAFPSTREWYEFINHKDSAYELGMFLKLGSFAWLVIALTALETLATIKFSRGLFTEPCPKIVLYAWGIGLGGMVVALLVWQVVLTMRARKRTVH